MCNDALHVIGLYGPGGQDLSFLAGLGAGKGGIELSHGPAHAMPGHAWALVAGLPLPKEALCHSKKALLSPWTGCDKKGEGCGERKLRKREREERAFFEWSWLVWFLSKFVTV